MEHYFGAHYDSSNLIESAQRIKNAGGNLIQIFLTLPGNTKTEEKSDKDLHEFNDFLIKNNMKEKANRILVYYPPNNRSIVIETICKTIKENGYEVIVLTLTPPGTLHAELEKNSIQTYTHILIRKNSWIYFNRHARFLRTFCKKMKIDIVLSHLQEGNIISVLAWPFRKARLINFRHHAEGRFYKEFGKKLGMRRSRKEIFLDKMINRLAKRIIVPSSDVWRSMKEVERCNMKKVQLIPYIYDFSAYQKPDAQEVALIREKYSCKLLLLMVSRMITTKQHQPVFEVVNKLVQEGLSLKMIVMDEGPLKQGLEKYVQGNKLEDKIIFTGFRKDFVNYMAAADMLMHPSLTEASSNVVKEMGLLEKTVAVCRGVGDFDDYIISGKNGFILDPENLSFSIENAIREAYDHPGKLQELGHSLHTEVLNYFSDTPENRKPYLELLGKA